MNKANQRICKMCRLHKKRTQVVVSDGGIRRCDWVLVGEGPGGDEDREGKPFVGNCGRILRKAFKKYAGLVLGDECIVLNSVSCRPPGNRNPKKDESEMCLNWLRLNIAMIQPKLVCAVGRFAAASFIKGPVERGLFYNKKHMRDIWQKDRYCFKLMHIWHPGYLLRNGSDKNYMTWYEHMNKFKEMMENV